MVDKNALTANKISSDQKQDSCDLLFAAVFKKIPFSFSIEVMFSHQENIHKEDMVELCRGLETLYHLLEDIEFFSLVSTVNCFQDLISAQHAHMQALWLESDDRKICIKGTIFTYTAYPKPKALTLSNFCGYR